MRRRASAASSEQHAADEEAHLDRHDTDTVLGDADKPWKCVLHCKEAVCCLSRPADAMPQQWRCLVTTCNGCTYPRFATSSREVAACLKCAVLGCSSCDRSANVCRICQRMPACMASCSVWAQSPTCVRAASRASQPFSSRCQTPSLHLTLATRQAMLLQWMQVVMCKVPLATLALPAMHRYTLAMTGKLSAQLRADCTQ